MDREFLMMLDQARHLCKLKFKIIKGYVSPDGQVRKNELNNSSHLIGRACEILCQHNYKRYRIITSLLEVGFTRIAFADDRIYVDNDDLKPDSIWHYRVVNKKFYINPI
jgi:hypothetical protein